MTTRPPTRPPNATGGSVDPIRQAFIAEASELLEGMGGLLMDFESAPPSEDALQELRRMAHNLKGASGTASLNGFTDVVHAFEEALSCLEPSARTMGVDSFDVLFSSLDTLEASLEELGTSNSEPESLADAQRQLERWIGTQRETGGREQDEEEAGGFVLGEYDRVRIKVLRARGVPLHHLTLKFTQGPGLDQRRHDAVVALAKAGTVVTTLPTESSWEENQDLPLLEVLFATEQDPDEAMYCAAELVEDWRWVPFKDEPRTTTVAPYRHMSPSSLRVDVAAVDNLVDLIGELVIIESMLGSSSSEESRPCNWAQGYLRDLNRITRELQDMGMRMRMVPLRNTFRAMRRMVRDVAQRGGRRVELVLEGEDTEIDRAIVERLHDPLVHLLRNAYDHGIEDEIERSSSEKPPIGTIRLSARQQGASILVEVSDDGRGLDRSSIEARARALGLTADTSRLSDEEVFEFVFKPGFSTAKQVTSLSGRGVGMDVVRRNVEAMRGSVAVSSQAGVGTTVRISLPITLAIIDGMLVACGGERYILPSRSIVESVQPRREMLSTQVGRAELLRLRGSLLPVVRLSRVFEIGKAVHEAERGIMVVVEAATTRFALMVDEVLVQHQIVIKSIGHGLPDSRFLSGAAILPDGEVGLILNVDELLKLEEQDQRQRAIPRQAGALHAVEATP